MSALEDREVQEPMPAAEGQAEGSPSWVSRRKFIAGSGALVVGISLPRLLKPGAALADAPLPPPIPLNLPPAKPQSPVPSAADGPPANAVDSWLAVGADNNVTVFLGKCELGTGTATATMQIVADELNVGLDQLSFVLPDTVRTVDQGVTAGSMTMKTQWAAGLRQAAATARVKLLDLASTFLDEPTTNLETHNGVVRVFTDPERAVTYGELIGDQAFNTNITINVAPKDPSELKLVGKRIPRIDIPEKVTGNYEFVQDVKLPGMVHGRVVRPPTMDSTLISVDDKPVAGFASVVVQGNFIGVAADKEWQAIKAQTLLKPKWSIDPLPPQEGIFDAMVPGATDATRNLVDTLFDGGSVEAAIAEAPKQLSATYNWPYQMHGPMGPPCALADVQPGGATIYSGTQGVFSLRQAIAGMLSLPITSVRVIYVEAAGCYGLDGEDNAALDAALMSHALGRPVRVQYMRADAHTFENFGTPMTMQHSAGLDDDGNIIGWNVLSITGNRGNRPAPAGNLPTGNLIGLQPPPAGKSPPPEPPLGPDSSNAVTQYNVPRSKVVVSTVASPARLFTGPLRSPQRVQNTFANESFMDEMAHAANAGPLAYRMNYLTDPRLIAVFQKVTSDAKWNDHVRHSNPGKGTMLTGQGLAGMEYEGTGAYAAVVVHLTVDTSTGKVMVNNVWGAQDCGIAINPDGMTNQAQGCCIQGISRALKEEVRWGPKAMKTVDWVTYPILRFNEMPDSFHLSIIDRPNEPALGAGEVVITAIVAAIANGIFDATGARLRQVPMTPTRVKAALKSV